MSNFPNELRYSKSHEWMRKEADSIVTVGITEFAQNMLGDLVFVDLPEVNAKLSAGDEAAVVESVKTAADVYAPLSGEIVEVNEALASQPEVVNKDPYGEGWLFRIKVDDLSQLDAMLDASAYQDTVKED